MFGADSPISTLAVHEFLKKFRSTLDQRQGAVQQFDRSLIIGLRNEMEFGDYGDINIDINNTTISIYDLLNKGTYSKHKELLRIFYINYNLIPTILNVLHTERKKFITFNTEDNNANVTNALSYYSTIYERLVPLNFPRICGH